MTAIVVLVLLGVAACQIATLYRARAASPEKDGPRIADLAARFADDIQECARRGQGPDWPRYRAELDRLFEAHDDRLRSLAAAALAIGLGGTLLALLVTLVGQAAQRGEMNLDPMAVLTGTGVCLIGSLLGVIVNLRIVLGLLPRAQRRFTDLADPVLQGLERIAEQHRPQEALTEALRQELGAIRQSFSTEFSSAFSTAITGFPEVVERLAWQLELLVKVVEAQGRGIDSAVRDLSACSLAVASSSQELQPTARKLADASALLVDLPSRLREVIDSSRETWLASLREQQEESVRQLVSLQREAEEASRTRERQMLAAVRELQASVSEVRAAVGQIPGQLTTEVGAMAGRLGREFGNEARVHTQDLVNHLAGEYQRLLERVEEHEKRMRNDIGSAVEELLAKVANRVDEGIVAHLQAAGEELRKLAATLPGAAQRLETAQTEWVEAQRDMLAGWNLVNERTNEAARKLAAADGKLGAGVEALAASALHLERIAHADGEFESSLRTALREVTASHLAELKPFYEDLMGMAHELNDGRARLDTILDRQSAFVEQCIAHLMKGRQVATMERSS
ncbi:MAG TPA: hypothetical protein VHQ90_00565 [Thermoanaerobaculia bacterium]|nr:hypothetical protein [Thermoanaerobaculia bacterium]